MVKITEKLARKWDTQIHKLQHDKKVQVAIMFCTAFEGRFYHEICEYLENEGIVIPYEWLKNQRFYDILHIAYMLELFDKSTLSDMLYMNAIRNRLVHPINVRPNQDFPSDKETEQVMFYAAKYNEILIKAQKAMNETDEKKVKTLVEEDLKKFYTGLTSLDYEEVKPSLFGASIWYVREFPI